ncbi:MAG: (d)CMP kinase [Candidatus Azobacteroides sp.]|nr:(d)CMP kinase [Candidatus Azobacteroides sp.]
MKKITIAIDGFSSCGKSTMAKYLAKKTGYIYIDTGAMYRAVTLFCIQNGWIKNGLPDEEKLREQIETIHITFVLNPDTGLPETYLNGKNVEREIRSMSVSDLVSPVSAIGFVRKAMVKQQQEMGKSKGVVLDGRDIGTVVFPDAELKIFMTASPEIRAQRRYDELKGKGEDVCFEEILENVKKRDHIDQTRAESPLQKAGDAIVLDNTNLNVEEQNKWLLNLFEKTVNP